MKSSVLSDQGQGNVPYGSQGLHFPVKDFLKQGMDYAPIQHVHIFTLQTLKNMYQTFSVKLQ